ncbi:hypothetical protein HCH_01359 [Hahella chejuensis KCTC 2396]|uniref:Uncharacterized protein n=1 Tax=Hahella chejuensis (strain KCTC 2396) TaxID=349521 RepID=Q2SMA0_HAHCH|nr:hypothetical protein HCH_01359 [Hahella chejuensis KCTC 2396]
MNALLKRPAIAAATNQKEPERAEYCFIPTGNPA